jgi:hypothetical protein
MWSTTPPTEPGFYWARALFLGEGAEPVRVALHPHFAIGWEEFVAERERQRPEDRVPLEWSFEVKTIGSDVPYALTDFEAWGPRVCS